MALAASAGLTFLIIVGSRNLEHYDAALFGYTVASVVAFGAVVFRYAIWLQRPATRVYWRRGWKLFRDRKNLIANTSSAAKTLVGGLAAQKFIFRRGFQRWLMHQLIMWGCIIYLLLITLIFYRFTFVKLTTVTLTPPYWINMGAVAITTLAGARLIIVAPSWELLSGMAPFLKGFTLFFWAAGTWWIPLLLILGVWRHIRKHFPLAYDPLYWGMVFPLGMYTVCTFQLSKAISFEPLMLIPRYFAFVAIAAWLAVFVGLIHSLLTRRISTAAVVRNA